MSYTPKTEDQLAWDLIKVAVRAKVNVEVANYRNRRIDAMLGELWPAFRATLDGEDRGEIDPMYETWIVDALAAGFTRELTSADR